jgi:hypothetical protein
MRAAAHWLLFTSLAPAVGCSSSHSSSAAPIDATGEYTGAVTNGASTCPGTWTNGQMAAVNVTVSQTDDGHISLRLTGLAAVWIDLTVGNDSFNGGIDGPHIDAILVGSKVQTEMASGCSYTMAGNLSADLSGDTMTGTVIYTPQIDDATGCAALATCSQQQTFTLTRMH